MFQKQFLYIETVKKISNFALGLIIFSIYHQHNSSMLSELKNEQLEIQCKNLTDKLDTLNKILNIKLELLEAQYKKEIKEMDTKLVILNTTLENTETQHKKEINELENQNKMLNVRLLNIERFVRYRR